jgi:SAM-dependent methyltransferase
MASTAKRRTPYDAATYRAKNRIVRWSHGTRFRVARALIDPKPGERILDIGAGDGHLLRLCWQACPEALYAALEPIMAPKEFASPSPIEWHTTPERLGDGGPFNKIGCFEVLEHLSDPAIDGILDTVRSHLAPGGQFIVSVPVEIGPPAAVKHLVHSLAGRRRRDASLRTIAWCVLGLTDRVPRVGERLGHTGFDHRKLFRRITSKGGMTRVRTVTSPVAGLPTWMSSQVFWIFAPTAG